MNYYFEALEVMNKLYGKDSVLPLATVNEGKANLRNINAYYKDESFYITTYALSTKVKDITSNPSVALAHDLFVAHGSASNIGHPLDVKNIDLRDELRRVFIAFYDKHVDEQDENTCILKIDLIEAIIFDNNYKYTVNFIGKTSSREDFIVDIAF